MESIFVAELIGTLLLVLLGNGVVACVVLEKSKGNGSGWMVITSGWAFAVFVGVMVAGPYSGSHINPAVTIGLAIAQKTAWQLVPTYLAGQMVGAMLGGFFVWLAYKDHFSATENETLKLACFSTIPAIRKPLSNLLNEIIGTFVLMFAVFYLSGPTIENGANASAKIGLGSIGALPVAIIVWAIGLSLGGPTGYAINPARDLGPRIIHAVLFRKATVPSPPALGSDWGYAWVPVLGPILGGVIAAAVYMMLS